MIPIFPAQERTEWAQKKANQANKEYGGPAAVSGATRNVGKRGITATDADGGSASVIEPWTPSPKAANP